jgi:hypothetical protein
MGLFDLFKKKSNEQNTSGDVNHIVNPERSTNVPIDKVNEGSHGDHWGALWGFNTFYNNKQLAKEMIALILYKGAKIKIDSNYFKQEITYPDFKASSINTAEGLMTAYPVIKSGISIDTKTKVIKEWQHVNGIEAQIEAKGKNTFGLSYFATDYLENKTLYQSKFDLNIRLTGFAYSVTSPPHMENMAPDFVGYIPNGEHGKLSVLDYVGKIIALKEINEPEFGVNGYLASLRLIQMEEDKDFFVVETFICKENMEIPGIAVGDRISGSMWLQGQIVL